MVVRHTVREHEREDYKVQSYERGNGTRVEPFKGEYKPLYSERLQRAASQAALEKAEDDVKSNGAPEWWPRYVAGAAARAERGPGSLHRIQHPSWEDLSREEADGLRQINQRYDASMNVSVDDVDPDTLKSLTGQGFVRTVNGRVIPNWVFTENNAKDLGRYEGK